MDYVIKMLRLKLCNERIFRADATRAMIELRNAQNSDDYLAYRESHDNADRIIPQLERAIELLSKWKEK